MQRVVMKKLGKEMLGQANRESSNVRGMIKDFSGMIKDSWHSIIECVPKMIRLIIELLKSDQISDKAKFTLVGAMCVIGFLFAESMIGVTTIFPLLVFLAGPISAILMIPFYGAIKSMILTLTVFVIIHTFNNLIQSDEIDKLIYSVFGEKDGKQLKADLQSIYDKFKKYLEPIADNLIVVFEKIGRKKKKFDPNIAGEEVLRATNKNVDSATNLADNM